MGAHRINELCHHGIAYALIERDRYKYELLASYETRTRLRPHYYSVVANRLLELWPDGRLVIREGYAWDGPSGPTFDTPEFMRGSLVHDALYQLIEEDCIRWGHRRMADRELWRICREDGMGWLRASWVYIGVRLGGWTAIFKF